MGNGNPEVHKCKRRKSGGGGPLLSPVHPELGHLLHQVHPSPCRSIRPPEEQFGSFVPFRAQWECWQLCKEQHLPVLVCEPERTQVHLKAWSLPLTSRLTQITSSAEGKTQDRRDLPKANCRTGLDLDLQ